MFEYFFLHMFYYDYISALGFKYWTIMWFFPIVLSFLILGKNHNIGILCLIIHIFALFEDISYFIGSGIYHKKYPYPVSNWYDDIIGSFKLFHLGTALKIFPFVPIYYIYYMCIILTYICLFIKEKQTYINMFNIYIVPTTICQIFLPPKWEIFIPVWLCLVFIMIIINKLKYIFKRQFYEIELSQNQLNPNPETISLL